MLSLQNIALLTAIFTIDCLLASCAHVPDVPVCVEINQVKGFCTNTISDHDYVIDEQHPVALNGEKPKTWWQMRPFMVLVPTSSWKQFKEYIIEQCKRTNCDQYIQSWDRKIQELDGAAAK
jgi:hypothetical protein